MGRTQRKKRRDIITNVDGEEPEYKYLFLICQYTLGLTCVIYWGFWHIAQSNSFSLMYERSHGNLQMSRNSLSNQGRYNLVEEEKTSTVLRRLWYGLCKCCSQTRFSSDCWVPECSVVISTHKLLQCSRNGNRSYTHINLLDSVLHLCVIQIKYPGSVCVSFLGLGNVLWERPQCRFSGADMLYLTQVF